MQETPHPIEFVDVSALPSPTRGEGTSTDIALAERRAHCASHLHLGELAVLHLRGAERDLDDVADVGELAWAGGARIFDLLAFADRLQPVERIVDLHARIVVGDLA